MTDFKPFTCLRSFFGHRLARGASALGLAAGLLAGCGGSSQVEGFVSHHLHVFGDELTVLEAGGFRYGINGFNAATPPVFDCTLLPIWPQVVASALGKTFEQCPGTVTSFTAFGHGAYGAKVADFEAQLNAQTAALVANDVVAFQVGMNDVIALWNQVEAQTLSQADAESQAQALGQRVAAQVPPLIAKGVKVVVVSPPYLGTSPWALEKEKAKAGAAAAIGRLSDALGSGITLAVGQLDARDVIMANGSDVIDNYVNGSNNGSGINVKRAACSQEAASLLACMSNALVAADTSTNEAAATSTTYLWADKQHPGYLFHSTVSSSLVSLLKFF